MPETGRRNGLPDFGRRHLDIQRGVLQEIVLNNFVGKIIR